MVRAAIALGSNVGDRMGHLDAATEALRNLGSVAAVSPIYESAPIGGPEQGRYLNAVAVLDTTLAARDLLDGLLDIELERGRERTEKWGPRTLDLDLLLYGAESIDEVGLTVPHPRMTERRFVLDPLLDVWPDAALPDGTPLADHAEAVAHQEITPFDDATGFNPWTALTVFVVFNVAAAVVWRVIAWF